MSIGKTRAGIEPDDNYVVYNITTKMMENYLQSKIDFVVKQNGGEKVTVTANTFPAGSKFYPIILGFPDTILKYKENPYEGVVSIIDTKSNDKIDYVRDDIQNIIKNLQYSDASIKKLFEEETKKLYGISTSNALTMKQFQRTKKLSRNKNDKDGIVCTVIDPLVMFHDMLTWVGDNRKFILSIERIKKIEDGNWEYKVVREIMKSKKKTEKALYSFFNNVVLKRSK